MLRKIQNKLLRLRDFKTLYRDRRAISLIRKSDFYDAEWYLNEYPDVKAAKLEPARHYYRSGGYEGRDPGPFFSSTKYLKANPDVANSPVNPLLHFLIWGKKERRALNLQSSVIASNTSKLLLSTSDQSIVMMPEIEPDLEEINHFSEINNLPHRSKTGRVAVFASYSKDGAIHPYVIHYLRELRKHCDWIIFVSDNYFSDDELKKLHWIVDDFICDRHGEYDFGSYKRGIERARECGVLKGAYELILCNDSCYGPVGGFGDLFDAMAHRSCDFWGLTSNVAFGYHLQSYFLVFKKKVFKSEIFNQFFQSVKAEPHVSHVVLNYEVKMTSIFEQFGFRSECYITDEMEGVSEAKKANPNLTIFPDLLIKRGCPLIKVKAFTKADTNFDSIAHVLVQLAAGEPELYSYILEHANPARYVQAAGVQFSIIMPFYNRRETIFDSIESVRNQTHKGFELIMIDDGSDDGTHFEILKRYQKEFQEGRFRLIRSERQNGVSFARNAGLNAAINKWIAYVDSDNEIKPYFLATFASRIIENPKTYVFYSTFQRKSDGRIIGDHPFSRSDLLAGNYIDLGTFIHSRDRFKRLGGFDTNMKRLVDWDLIIRYTEDSVPIRVRHPLMAYSDEKNDNSRISVRESFDKALSYLRKKHNLPFIVQTIIPTYNHEKFIAAAIESAIAQKGDFIHKILVCDDGSTDKTRSIVKTYAARYPNLVRDISNDINMGLSETFRKCFSENSGDVIAILEGDDYWSSADKLQKQLNFLKSNDDAIMVFSMIDVLNTKTKKSRQLQRQLSQSKSLLSGADFLADPSMNLIGNFSSCMFRSGVMRTLPDRLFDGRFNEIALAFHLERHGKIGFLKEVLGVYRQHPQGVWTGSNKKKQLESAIKTREMVLDVAAPSYRPAIKKIIEQKKSELTSRKYA
ncbi:glycosyltransferase [Ochrobactrum sp. Marseille-Q0166]|uniref:glycosyltransferase n=1 Tax=Ochrobactrum sp. Marseille-Q0166 TaxID=2761105 RepID=UPI0016558B2C|nr:glycosyltransferase [Ochrobactrum sp. Marseille-Q0166]MBC8718762.1 glycosyltransferase [Ochrobactrum sp. Marseille-Q0166]